MIDRRHAVAAAAAEAVIANAANVMPLLSVAVIIADRLNVGDDEV